MINLLPPYEKEKIRSNRIRSACVILTCSVILFFFCIFIFFATFDIYLGIELRNSKNELKEAEAYYQKDDLKDFKAELASINGDLAQLNKFFTEKIYVSNVLSEFFKNIEAPQIYLKNVTIFSDKEGKYNIASEGIAKKRDDLFYLKKKIESDKFFSDLKFPQENWVKAEDVNFNISVKTVK